MDALRVRAHPPIPRSMRLASAAGTGARSRRPPPAPRRSACGWTWRRVNRTERIHVAACARTPPTSTPKRLNIRAGPRLRMRTKTPAGDRASCLRSALGGPYP